ncbi:MAG: YebC/PmpR family DNA-binding transcriptional regulator [Alphaproteobacteria bacterium]|nr:YebC/PmpR family DNA-binding transcriptional regulator [Alphaproteobacteria bacterium]
MAGHSKFKNIMHRKGAQDKKRAKVFSKLSREITVAAKMSGNDVIANPRLRLAISAAKAESMPKDNIQRAIDKTSGDKNETDFQEVRYEGYGPVGIAIIVEGLTDNRNRTASEIRTCFARNGGHMQDSGSVVFQFDRIGQIVYPSSTGAEDAIFETALEAGAENISSDDDEHVIHTEMAELNAVSQTLQKCYGDSATAGLIWHPKATTTLNQDQAQSLINLIEVLEDNDDVQHVFTNADIPNEILEHLS